MKFCTKYAFAEQQSERERESEFVCVSRKKKMNVSIIQNDTQAISALINREAK